MKKFYLSLLLLAISSFGKAQTSDSLITINNGVGNPRSGHMFFGSNDFVPLDTLEFNLNKYAQTYDMLREQMFACANQGNVPCIVRIDARSGLLEDTLATGIALDHIECDLGMNTLTGMKTSPSGLLLYSISTLTKTVSPLNTLSDITTVPVRPTSNMIQSIVYAKTNLGIASIDANTGDLLDTIWDPYNCRALEFHPGTMHLYGVYQNSSLDYVFFKLNPNTKSWSDIAVLTGVTDVHDLSSLDIMASRYVVKTNLGLTFVRLGNGSISGSISGHTSLAFEYINKLTIVNPNSVKGVEVPVLIAYPNPSRDRVKINGIETGKAYRLWSSDGKLVQEGMLENDGIDLSKLSSGIYQLRFSDGSGTKIMRQH